MIEERLMSAADADAAILLARAAAMCGPPRPAIESRNMRN